MSLTTCYSCTRRTHPIPGEGPQPSRVAFFGEGPARDEHRQGRPFVGRAGRELSYQYMPLAGLCRGSGREDDAYISNVMKCVSPGYGNPDLEECIACSKHWVPRELRYTQPEVVVTLGAMACHTLFPDCNMSIEHGYPRYDAVMNPEIAEWTGTHVAIYHPAAGMRSPEWMIPIQRDFEALRTILRGEFVLPVDEHPNPFYREIDSRVQLASICQEVRANGWPLAMDTEVVRLESREPWCLSLSHQPGYGFMVPASRPDLLAVLAAFIRDHRPLVVLHNYLFDKEVLERMGINVERFVDTMELAYHLMDLPQGLKALAWRLCGMEMQDFEDLVAPYARTEVLAYLEAADQVMAQISVPPPKSALPKKPRKPRKLAVDQEILDYLNELERVTAARARIEAGDKDRNKAHRDDPAVKAAAKIHRLLGDVREKPETNPWKRWKDWSEEEREIIQALCGKLPLPSITQVPREKAVYYASRDSDATLRLLPLLQERAARFRRLVA